MSTHSGPRDWDADTYDRVSDIQLEWGREVVERLPLRGDETVLDAGCGSGRVTELLVERLPRGRVIGVDASADMVRKAAERLGERAELRVADLAELELDEPADAAFSNAVFHWVPDHERLFARLHAALRPGARLVAQCGGQGNVADLIRVLGELATEPPWDEHLGGFQATWNFAGPAESEERLRRAGFRDVRCWREEKLVRPEEPQAFLRVVTCGPHLAHLPEDLHDAFVDAVADRLGEPLELLYVRLNIDARRAG